MIEGDWLDHKSTEYRRGWEAAGSGGALVLAIEGGNSWDYATGFLDRMKTFVGD